MQTTRKAVRYYIDREADTPIIRTVPVIRANIVPSSGTETPGGSGQAAPTLTEAGREQRDARHRLVSLVQAGMRKYRHHAS